MSNIYLQKRVFVVKGKYDKYLTFEVTEDNVKLFTKRGDTEFVFDSDNGIERMEKWQDIGKMITDAAKFCQKLLDKSTEDNISLPNRKGSSVSKNSLRHRSRKAKAK